MPNFSGLWTERQQMQVQGAGTWPAFPGAPTIGTATAGAGSASVAFTAPSYTGYPAGITSYTATSNPGGFTGTGASSPITVSGLTNGTAYTFTVTATNATGTGPASAASNSVTPSANYIEDVFSTYLWTGTDATQTITNNIDLSTKGGLVWMKRRDSTGDNGLFDTVRGSYRLISNSTAAQAANSQIASFNTTGFTLSAGGDYNSVFGGTGETAVGWTFRKQPKFFDVVTYTGNGTAGLNISHSLGSTPGCIIVKRTDSTGFWCVYHRQMNGGTMPQNYYMFLNGTSAQDSAYNLWNNTAPTSTQFTVGNDTYVNASGGTYVAYIFAHDAGGFGLTGTDNVITCGMYTKGTDAYVNLGWEPQWVMVKPTNVSGQSWFIQDNMRGMPATSGANQCLFAESSSAESGVGTFNIDATGFTPTGFANGTQIIYIAIRRGPMKVPTDGTKVYNAVKTNAASTPTTITFDTTLNGADWGWGTNLNNANRAYGGTSVFDRLRGSYYLFTNDTAAEGNSAGQGFSGETSWIRSFGSGDVVGHFFKRAPSFFDEVCYTGTGANQNVTHNLGVAPELIIVKSRSTNPGANWVVWNSTFNASTGYMYLNADIAYSTFSGVWNGAPTSTYFTLGTNYQNNNSGTTFVAYLFATCAGVSKVGSYTGTGTLTTINCGFTGGARFVLIKRTDSTSNWFVWDTARGMVAGTDPSLALNSTAAESNANSVYTATTGFQLLASPSADVNTNGGSYIYLAIA